jgi:hypothetical protein
MRIRNHVADAYKSTEQPAKREYTFTRRLAVRAGMMELPDGFLEGFSLDKPRGVVRATIRVLAQAVDRNNPWVLKAPRDLSLEQEPCPALTCVGLLVLDLLERNLAIQFAVERDKHPAEPSFGVQASNLKSLCAGTVIGRELARRMSPGPISVSVRFGGSDVRQAGLDIGIGELVEQ